MNYITLVHIQELAKTAAEYLRTKDENIRKEFFANLNELLYTDVADTVEYEPAHIIVEYLKEQPKYTHKAFIEYLNYLLENKDEEE